MDVCPATSTPSALGQGSPTPSPEPKHEVPNPTKSHEVSEISNLKSEILRASSSPSSLRDSSWTRESIEAKLLDRLEAGFNMHIALSTPLLELTRRSGIYLPIMIRTHFRVPTHVAWDIITASRTVLDLVNRLTDLLCPGLFATEPRSDEATKTHEVCSEISNLKSEINSEAACS